MGIPLPGQIFGFAKGDRQMRQTKKGRASTRPENKRTPLKYRNNPALSIQKNKIVRQPALNLHYF